MAESSPATRVEAHHAAAEEGAATLADFLLRRSGLGLYPGRGIDVIEGAADALAEVLGWDAARRTEEIATYRALIDAEAPQRLEASG
jgi:glycerol-3-phosphate dehydrogenase